MSRQVWEEVEDKADEARMVEVERKRAKEEESAKRKRERV